MAARCIAPWRRGWWPCGGTREARRRGRQPGRQAAAGEAGALEAAIDAGVYALYGLTPDEIALVERGVEETSMGMGGPVV
jgi:hypothetical protein